MIFGSVCSGIEAASVAWHPLGWRAAWFSEIEPFPNAVLAYRWPEVENYGDMTKFKEWGLEHGTIDVLVGGTPCQSFSVAGLRKGLADPRGNLALVFLAIVDRARPRWVVWENVPGVLSSGRGRDFGSFLGGLAKLRYGFAYRVLDAQYFGVPQRRRRVFVVGHLGDWRRAVAVLFERESLSGNPPPSRETREGIARDVAPSIRASGRGLNRVGESRGQDPVIPVAFGGNVTHSLRADGFDAGEDGTGRGTPILPNCRPNGGRGGIGVDAIQTATQVRRLTPRECERLQGFPDDYTLVEYRGKPACAGPRYKALGNSMAVPVMVWIGKRIERVEGTTNED